MSQYGNIKITDEVISSIAGAATLRVEGVYDMSGSVVENISEMLGKKVFSKGVSVTFNNDEAKIDISIIAQHGYNLQEVAINVQKSIEKDIHDLVGVKVEHVNVYIDGMKFSSEEKNKPKEENEEREKVSNDHENNIDLKKIG